MYIAEPMMALLPANIDTCVLVHADNNTVRLVVYVIVLAPTDLVISIVKL